MLFSVLISARTTAAVLGTAVGRFALLVQRERAETAFGHEASTDGSAGGGLVLATGSSADAHKAPAAHRCGGVEDHRGNADGHPVLDWRTAPRGPGGRGHRRLSFVRVRVQNDPNARTCGPATATYDSFSPVRMR